MIRHPEAPQNVLDGSHPGDRCPRAHCGGLLILRAVETTGGACDEVVCASCSRSRLLRVREPYAPIPSVRDPKLASLLVPDRPAPAAPDTDDNEDSGVPSDVLESVAPRTTWFDESLLSTPPD